MGMIGYYFRANEAMLKEIKKGDTASVVFREEYQDNMLDIDKTWHAIHFVLNGDADKGKKGNICGKLVFGNKRVNRDDLGYGPATLLEKEEVVQMAEELEKWDEKTFQENFHMEDMIEEQIYPIMPEEEEQEFFQYVWTYFVELKEFFKKAAKEGQYVIYFIF